MTVIIQQYFQDRPCMFQPDNACVHLAHEMQELFHDQPMKVLDWTPHLPDLNHRRTCVTLHELSLPYLEQQSSTVG